MNDEKKQNLAILRIEEQRLLSLIAHLKNNVDSVPGVSFAADLFEAETRLLLLRRVIDVQQFGAFK